MHTSGIEEILARLKIPFLRESGHHHCRPGWLQLDCPFCGGLDKFHLGYNLQSGYWHCWKCGGLPGFKTLYALGATPEEVDSLKGRSLVPAPATRHRGRLEEPKHRGPLLAAHNRYLRGRGLVPATIAQVWQVEGIGIAPRLGWRLYIPIHLRGERVSWTTRSIGKTPFRYVSASAQEESVNHKHVVYGLDLCSHSVVIVEGPVDAWAIGPGAGALFGTAYSVSQVEALARIPLRFVCFDRGAQSHAKKIANELSCFAGRTEIIQLDADDPGSASTKELEKLRRAAKIS